MITHLPFTATPAECRAALEENSRDEAVIFNVLRYARVSGLSAEDTYSLMAYHLCVAKDQMFNRLVEQANCTLRQPFIIVKEPKE